MACSRLIVVLIIALPLLVEAKEVSDVVALFPGSVVVDEGRDDELKTHQIITGSVARVNTRLVPKSSEYVLGKKSYQTLEVLNVTRTRDLGNFYREQLLLNGTILFECKGRTCGSSNYWANTVFKNSILYGPEQYQYSYVGRIVRDKSYYVAIYVAQRGTGKLYTKIETIIADDTEFDDTNDAFDEKLVSSALRLHGRYSFEPDATEQVLKFIADAINADSGQLLALVSHDNLQPGETVDACIERTKQVAEGLKSRLVGLGITQTRLAAYGAGPIAPVDLVSAARIDLVVIKES